MIHGSIPAFTDAFFETMSGYTTSGANILTYIEVVPHGLLLLAKPNPSTRWNGFF
jgi:trk system potassium uptake protein TrkH